MSAQSNRNSGFPLKRLTAILAVVWIALSFPLRLPPASWLQQSMHGAPQPAEAESAAAPFPDKPPFFFGRRSLTDVCLEYGIDETSITRELGGFAITARSEWSIKRIAEENDMEQEALFEVIRELSIDRGQPSDMIN